MVLPLSQHRTISILFNRAKDLTLKLQPKVMRGAIAQDLMVRDVIRAMPGDTPRAHREMMLGGGGSTQSDEIWKQALCATVIPVSFC